MAPFVANDLCPFHMILILDRFEMAPGFLRLKDIGT